MSSLIGVVRLLRPRQWIKNGFVLAPLFFSGEFVDGGAVISATFAVLLFCIASSAAYVVNDIFDVERDRCHPTKSLTRPLAAGTVKMSVAKCLLIVLYCMLGVGAFLNPKVGIVIAAYVALNWGYSLKLKHLPVIDIFTIAVGFVLRVYAGAMALDVPVSSWMFITTLCLSLYLAAVKRRQELCQRGVKGRKVLESYTVSLVERYAEMSAMGALLFYSMFVMSARPGLVITIPLVLYGLFRYWFVVDTLEEGESPADALFADWQLLLTVILWAGVCGWTIMGEY